MLVLRSRPVLWQTVLAYVGHENDHYISTYSSDPILPLGAADLWHNTCCDALSSALLPALKSLISQATVDVCGIDIVVARIVLLLAMDSCAFRADINGVELGYAGEFFPGTTFLKVLHGPFKDSSNSAEKAKTRQVKMVLKAKWKGWRVGFSQFVQLSSEPLEVCVWSMLARRAAGIFAKGHCAADLFIPMFDAATRRVSMILVQVKDQSHTSGFLTGMRIMESLCCRTFCLRRRSAAATRAVRPRAECKPTL